MTTATVKINRVKIPVSDILSIRTVRVTDKDFMDVQYRLFSPCYHTLSVLVDYEQGLQIKKAISEHKQHNNRI